MKPSIIYGTAWKEDATQQLVRQALSAGFRAIDTANQRKHYHEAGVGAALREAFADGLLTRDALFLQTKYTFASGQDHRLPYDPAASIATQVRQSFDSSLQHLGVERIDSYVLHGPSRRSGLQADDLEAWRAMEQIHAEGRAGSLGVSNVDLGQLVRLCEQAGVLPSFVQNRCFAHDGWDSAIRAACRERGIAYQGFSLLTANVATLRHPEVSRLAGDKGCTAAQIIFAFAARVGMIPLTGTTDPGHMREDLEGLHLDLSPAEVLRLETLSGAT